MRFAAIVVILLSTTGPSVAADVHGYAVIGRDGTVRVDGQTFRLAGVLMPDSGFFCDRVTIPARCAPRAVLALEAFLRHFVSCRPHGRSSDGAIESTCWQTLRPGTTIDLSAWLIEQGWALAAPGAPPLYAALERLARQRRAGLWGIPVDSR